MARRTMTPISDLRHAVQEHGRIRLGMKARKGSKTYPTSIDTFRFTSPDGQAIAALAELYGGVARPWNDDRATVRDQWEVISEAKEIAVWVGSGSMSQVYEFWTAAGCQRRCDGSLAMHARAGSMVEGPCVCNTDNTLPDEQACTPKTRLTVMLPEIRMAGGWRVETSSWHAAREMPNMMATIELLQGTGLAAGKLIVAEGMSKTPGGQTKRFTFPRLIVDATPQELVSGQAAVTAITAPIPEQRAIGPVSMEASPTRDEYGRNLGDDVIDAEVISDATVYGSQREAGLANPGRKIVKVSNGWAVEE